jgi:hypothetical protein
MSPNPRLTPAQNRKNAVLGAVLLVFACGLAASVFLWRYSHNQTAIPQGGSYGQTYQIQK